MTTRPLIVAVLLAAGPLAVPGEAQSLSDRIQTIRQQREEEAALNARVARAGMLQALRFRVIPAHFDRTPLRDVMDYLGTSLGIDIVGRYSDDRVGHGMDPTTPITLQAEKIQALELLERVLEQCSTLEECTWQLRRAFVEVGTKERLSAPAAQEIRTYPINDLLYEAPSFEAPYSVDLTAPYYDSGVYGPGFTGSITPGTSSGSFSLVPGGTDESRQLRARELIDLITELVEPMAWADNGGTWASIRHVDGTLIVRAPDFIHRQIGGYPRVAPPPQPPPATDPAQAGAGPGPGSAGG
jgi:hypothetical protein